MAWGPWLPYTQTSLGGSFPGVISGEIPAPREVSAQLQAGSPFPFGPNIYNDAVVRKCCVQHMVAGAPMDTVWTGACQTKTPGSSNFDPLLPSSPGIHVQWGVELNSYYWVRARQEWMQIYANTTPSHGMPSWQDPNNDSPPPQFEYDPLIGSFAEYEYQPFTALDGVVSFGTPGGGGANAHAGLPFELTAYQVPFGQDLWNDGGSGLAAFSLSVSAAGGSVIPLGSQTLTDLVTGYRWDIVASCQLDGYFFDNDPVLPDGGVLDIMCEYFISGIYNRYGMRRRRIPDVTPPLQQRQRGDGLGGGPPRSGLGQNARGNGLFARGVF